MWKVIMLQLHKQSFVYYNIIIRHSCMMLIFIINSILCTLEKLAGSGSRKVVRFVIATELC